jgi:hypothetical protein
MIVTVDQFFTGPVNLCLSEKTVIYACKRTVDIEF